jgi:hypothetical protein
MPVPKIDGVFTPMNNGFIPKVGDKVKIIGNCHPKCLGKIVEVTGICQNFRITFLGSS